MTKDTFAEKYCKMHGLANWEYNESALAHSLYPQARVLRPFLRLIPGFFKADREFISCVGRITRLRDFDMEVYAYTTNPANRGFLRRVLKMRVSAGRLNSLVWSTLRDGSSEPFAKGK